MKNRETDGVAETFYSYIPRAALKFANALANLPVKKAKILKNAVRFYCFRLRVSKKTFGAFNFANALAKFPSNDWN